jgi:methionine salvage enolase-phosphatase E1
VKAGKASSSIPAASKGKDAVLEAAVASVFAQMDEDRKTTALKALQAILSLIPVQSLHGQLI